MSEREVLLEWLSRASRRLQAQRVVRRWLRVLFYGAVLWLVHQVLRAAGLPVAVVGALEVLLWLAGAALALWGASVWFGRVGIEQSAYAADVAGRWHDELKSAYWFSREGVHSPVARVLLKRAARTAAGADMSQLWPWRTSRLLWGLFLVMGAAAVLHGGSPRLHTASPQTEDVRAQAGGFQRADPPSHLPATEEHGDTADGQARVRSPGSRGAPSLPSTGYDPSPEPGADVASLPAIDAVPATRVSRSVVDVPEAPVPGAAGPRDQPPELAGEWLGSVVARLKDLLEKDDVGVRDSNARAAGNAQDPARVGRSDRGDNVDRGQSDPDSQMRNADTSGNGDLRMNALGGVGPRNTLAGTGDGEEQSGRSGNSNSGALGRRINSSRAGAGDDGEIPQGDPGGSGPSPEVLGKKTMRLALQLRRAVSPAKSDDDAAPDDTGSAEDFFAATRQQAARAAPDDKARPAAQRFDAEALSTVETPLAYRAAAKAYFLSQHGKER